ncbi:MAG: M48 family metalloprotease [Kofleriaceae bacterium]
MVRLACLFVVMVACQPPREPEGPRPPDPDSSRWKDPINKRDLPVLRQIVESTLKELIAAMPEGRRLGLEYLQLEISDRAGAVNAFATCSGSEPLIGISEGLITIAARLATSKALDEILETDATRDLMREVSAPEPVANTTPYDLDRDKLGRQHMWFVEQIAFALGHELAHHSLSHLSCTSHGDALGSVGQLLPVFAQATELEADAEAVRNLLAVRRDQHGYAWTENGAILVLQMFKAQRERSVHDIIFAFEQTHPPPEVRIPVVITTAEIWNATDGRL